MTKFKIGDKVFNINDNIWNYIREISVNADEKRISVKYWVSQTHNSGILPRYIDESDGILLSPEEYKEYLLEQLAELD